MNKPYTATILGTDREVCGFNAKGNLMLTDGEEFVVTPLDMEPGTFRSLTIREIATLTYSGGKWLLGGKPLEKAWFPEVRRRVTELGRTNVSTLFNLCRLVGESYPGPSEQNPERLAELQNRVCAVAWTRERFDDYPGQSAEARKHEKTDVTEPVRIPAAKGFEPVLLTAFHSIGQQTRAPFRACAKPVARFEDDYTVAVIPRKAGREESLTVEPELKALIKRIIEAGGRIPRTELRKSKPGSYQPEKLLESQTAKKLIKAKLLGKTRSGRTTTYWAKAKAD